MKPLRPPRSAAMAALALGLALAWLLIPPTPARALPPDDSIGAAPETPLLTNVDHRATIGLDGPWHTIVDPYENGYYNYRYEPSDQGYFRNAKPASPADLVEYDFAASPTLEVPGDWNSQRPELLYYEGTVWYQRLFDYAPSAEKRAFLYFGAANYEARVYLNGKALGRHVGGFTPFCFEITDIVHDGENFVVVKVDNTRHRDAIPTVNTDWWNYGGLTRRVMVVETPRTFIREAFLQLDPARPDELIGWVQLDGEQLAQSVRIEIPEADWSHAVATDAAGRAEFRLAAPALERWSPASPRLYGVRFAAETDALDDEIGFRTIAARGRDILLNGEPVFLRGISIHEEAPYRGGRAVTSQDDATLIAWAKDLGCNFVRLAHYPHHEGMVRACERAGLLVWSEIPVYWTIAWESEATYANAEAQLTAMITRDRNRAAVGLWSVANETPRTEARLAFLRRLIATARRLDPTRPITAALETHYVDATTIVIDDPLGADLDILGCNEYIGWYDGPPAKADGIAWRTDYDKPLIISEFGGGARAGLHGEAGARWTEEYQESIYRHQVDMLERIDFLRGTSPWILMDFRSPRRPLPGIQDGWNRKGLISNDGERKKAFDVLQEFYRRKAAPK